MRHLLLILSLITMTSFALHGQNYQAEFLEAKRLYNNGEFTLAKDAFQTLTVQHPKNKFASYASFFFGLSAYKAGSYEEAKNMWLQLQSKFPDFDQKDELRWWLAAAYFKLGDYDRGNQQLDNLGRRLNDEGEKLRADFLSSQLSTKDLMDLYEDSKDRLVGNVILDRLISTDSLLYFEQQAQQIISDLELKEEDYFALGYVNEFKEEYKVAVMLPFGFDSLENADKVAKNRLVMDLYEGLQMAAEELTEQGKPITLYPYDTKGRGGTTRKLLENDEIKGMDLIVGPIYGGPFRLVHAFSKANRINMINPFSTSSMVMGDNPFSFLFKSGEITQALQLADYANRTFDNKVAYVFYEQRDSLLAATYKAELEKFDFEVPVFTKLVPDSLKAQAETLKAFSEVSIDSQFKEDSLVQYDYVTINTKRKNGEVVKYAEVLDILPDSIGHIYVSTRSNLAASNFITAVIERPDTIALIGKSEWLSIQAIPYQQLEDIGLRFVYPGFTPIESQAYQSLRKEMVRKYKSLPSDRHFTGYELMYVFGNLMHESGRYFQEGIRKGQFVEGKLSPGFRFDKKRDNQILSIVRISDLELKDVSEINDKQ